MNLMKTKVQTSFRENIQNNKLIEKNDTIIVGASGGPDSQFLIYLLKSIKDEYNLKIILAHLNHLHRKEAINDENLVKETAHKLNLEFRVKRASMDDYAKIHKISAEDAGRRLRYEFFNELASQYENSKIAIAHNKNDQAETVLMRLIRGTGLDGMVAMDFRNGNIIRPILSFSKDEIISYLDSNLIAYAIDKTNLSNDYTRNYIRNQIIPEFSTINPKAVDAIYNLSMLLKEDLKIVDRSIDSLYKEVLVLEDERQILFDLSNFDQLEDFYQKRLLRKAISKLKNNLKDISKKNIDEFLSLTTLATGKKIIKDDLEFIKNYKTYQLAIIENKENLEDFAFLSLDEEINFNGKIIKATLVNSMGEKSKNIAYFSFDKLKFPLKLRYRKKGDTFKPLGFNHNKKLKDFFIDQKIDRNLRDQIPIILSNDKIIWLVGFRQSEEFKADKEDKNIIKIEVRDDNWYKFYNR